MKKIYIFYGIMAVFGVVLGVSLQKLTEPVIYDHPTTQEAFCKSQAKWHPDCNV